ncbi:MAG: hypothetical protein LUE11_10755 [Clostridia bacterium]|nr:hypothetical protein [Clostridia bacterium]
MNGIAPSGTALDKTKSTGQNQRAEQERNRKENQDIVRLAELVGGRKSAYGRLCGSDWIEQPDGRCFVRFLHDKGGKNQLQLIAPEHINEVKAYFADKAADELIFPDRINKNLDVLLYGGFTEQQRKACEENPNIVQIGTEGFAAWAVSTEYDSTLHATFIWSDETMWNTMRQPAVEQIRGTYPQKDNKVMTT